MIPAWNHHYPDPNRLRQEVECLAECFVEALLDSITRRELRGIYLKGSAKKRWESLLDYVPEISDVDMHVWFRGDDTWRSHLGTVPQALDVQRKAEISYRAKIAHPLHEPRPQLIVMNKMVAELGDFVLSPRSTVQVLFGEEFPKGDYSHAGSHKARGMRPTDQGCGVSQCSASSGSRQAGKIHLGVGSRPGLARLAHRAAGASHLRRGNGGGVEPEPHQSGAQTERPGPRPPGRQLHQVLSVGVGILPLGLRKKPTPAAPSSALPPKR